jgi:eukaryotic-like serine/threonine-protein kinase
MNQETSTTVPSLAPYDQLTPESGYELLMLVASGGMGSVYLGRSKEKNENLVAIKRAHPHLAGDPAFQRMFLREARLASRIHHANVVGVQDVEHVDHELLLVLEYVDGGSLSDLIVAADAQSSPLDARVVVRVLLDAAAGLQAAHELQGEDGTPLGVVHRDISPHNILVGVDGTAKIADFGLAKDAPAHGDVTRSVGLRGKTGYMAPEYVRDQTFDARSDVFALGVVAWQALTGKRLFQSGNEIQTLKRVLGLRPRPPSELRPGLSPSLDDVVLRALEKAPEVRWQSARAFAAALAEAAVGQIASHEEVGRCVRALLGETLERRRRMVTTELAAPARAGAPEDYRTLSLRAPGPPALLASMKGQSSSFVGVGAPARTASFRRGVTWLPLGIAAGLAVMYLTTAVRASKPQAARPPASELAMATPNSTTESTTDSTTAALVTIPAPSPAATQWEVTDSPSARPRSSPPKSAWRNGDFRPRSMLPRATRPPPSVEPPKPAVPEKAVAAPNPYGPAPHA